MKKIKFFIDPIEDLEIWLNHMARKGYRLKAIHNFLYDFEKADRDYSYSTQFIGANSPRENKEYIQMLKEDGSRVYRAPLNQGNLFLARLKFRPYAHGSGKIANSFQDYNREILVVENLGKESQKLFTNLSDLAEQYKNIRNAYLQACIGLMIIFVYLVYKLYRSNFAMRQLILCGLAGIVMLVYTIVLYKVQRNYGKYKQESHIAD